MSCRVRVFLSPRWQRILRHTHTHTSSTSSSSPAEAAAGPLSRHLHDRGMHTLTYTPLTSRLTGRGTHFSTFTRYTSIHDDPFQGVTCSPRLRCSLIMYQHIGRYQRSKHRKSVASLNTTRRDAQKYRFTFAVYAYFQLWTTRRAKETRV